MVCKKFTGIWHIKLVTTYTPEKFENFESSFLDFNKSVVRLVPVSSSTIPVGYASIVAKLIKWQYSIDVWLQQGNQPDNSTSPRTPTQQGVVYVVHDANTGQVVLPPMTGNGHVNAENTKKTFIPQIILACFVFWLCGFLFGLIAFVLARKLMSILLLSACCTQKGTAYILALECSYIVG